MDDILPYTEEQIATLVWMETLDVGHLPEPDKGNYLKYSLEFLDKIEPIRKRDVERDEQERRKEGMALKDMLDNLSAMLGGTG